MARSIKVTVETESLLVLRGQQSRWGWCSQCGAQGEMIALDHLGVVSNMPPAEVEAWIQSEELHHTRDAEGAHLICLNSILKRVHRTKDREPGLGTASLPDRDNR